MSKQKKQDQKLMDRLDAIEDALKQGQPSAEAVFAPEPPSPTRWVWPMFVLFLVAVVVLFTALFMNTFSGQGSQDHRYVTGMTVDPAPNAMPDPSVAPPPIPALPVMGGDNRATSIIESLDPGNEVKQVIQVDDLLTAYVVGSKNDPEQEQVLVWGFRDKVFAGNLLDADGTNLTNQIAEELGVNNPFNLAIDELIAQYDGAMAMVEEQQQGEAPNQAGNDPSAGPGPITNVPEHIANAERVVEQGLAVSYGTRVYGDLYVYFDSACSFCHALYRDMADHLENNWRIHWIGVDVLGRGRSDTVDLLTVGTREALAQVMLTNRVDFQIFEETQNEERRAQIDENLDISNAALAEIEFATPVLVVAPTQEYTERFEPVVIVGPRPDEVNRNLQ